MCSKAHLSYAENRPPLAMHPNYALATPPRAPKTQSFPLGAHATVALVLKRVRVWMAACKMRPVTLVLHVSSARLTAHPEKLSACPPVQLRPAPFVAILLEHVTQWKYVTVLH